MIVNTRTGQGPEPCKASNCAEAAPKPEPELHVSISANVHISNNTPFEAVNSPNSDHAWLTIGNAGVALHVDAKDARRLAKALNALALAAEHGRVLKGTY